MHQFEGRGRLNINAEGAIVQLSHAANVEEKHNLVIGPAVSRGGRDGNISRATINRNSGYVDLRCADRNTRPATSRNAIQSVARIRARRRVCRHGRVGPDQLTWIKRTAPTNKLPDIGIFAITYACQVAC